MKKILFLTIILIIMSLFISSCEDINGDIINKNRFGGVNSMVITDSDTGCKYLLLSKGSASGSSPLIDSNGNVDGCKNIKLRSK